MKPSNKKLKYFIKDEKHAASEYRRYDLPELARDESRHSRVLNKKLKAENSPKQRTKVPQKDRRYVSHDIEHFRNEGYPPKQASAIAYSKERSRIAKRKARSIS